MPIFARGLPRVSTEDVYRSRLLPLLSNLRALHPRHLPTLLLLACVYHAVGEFDTSLALNEEILSIDPNYVRDVTSNGVSGRVLMSISTVQVEAMCNMGTTLKALNRFEDAQAWWRKAIERRPTYWDVLVCLISLDNRVMLIEHRTI
jgi:protein O-GlcNAc transferase